MTALLPPNVKVHLALGYIDMRKGIISVDVLAAAIEQYLGCQLKTHDLRRRRNWHNEQQKRRCIDTKSWLCPFYLATRSVSGTRFQV